MKYKCLSMLFWGATIIWSSVSGLENAPHASPTSSPIPPPLDALQYPSLDAMEQLYQPYLVNLLPYEPTYFLMGVNPEDSKFQLSFKYRPFDEDGSLDEFLPWITGTHMAYTQTSFWDLKSDSQPFEDTSYKPELFLLSKNLDPGWPGIKGLFMQSGVQHESNGRGGDLSRSSNFVYLKPTFILYNKVSQLGLLVAPRLWVYSGNDDQMNPDLKHYRGYFDLQVKAGHADGLVIDTHTRWAKHGASIQVDGTYPLDRFFNKNLDLYLQVQYTNSLAESLLHYQDRVHTLRIGFALVR